MKVSTIAIEDAVGLPLAHDLTQVDAAKKIKGARFRRGHLVSEEDFPVLRQMGRLNLTVLDLEEWEVHEDEAALALAKALAGEGLEVEGPEEGRCRLLATSSGVARFDAETVRRVNLDREWSFATCPVNAVVSPKTAVAAFRILPLALDRASLERAVKEARPFSVKPFLPLKVGLVTTGSEIKAGLVKDKVREKLDRKLEELGGSFAGQRFCGDGAFEIEQAVGELLGCGADIVICTGGMSVDADDRTPEAIRSASDEVLFRGVPAMPGSNLMLAKSGKSWVIGAPACAAHDERTALDRLLVALFAGLGEEIDVKDWGVGGLCSRCSTCVFPDCGFARLPG